MDRAWLTTQLTAGRSIESIAREVEKHPSTVAYWVNTHGLTSTLAPKHAAKGGVSRADLEALVGAGMSIREIAAELQLSATSVRHWLGKYGLRTRVSRMKPAGVTAPELMQRCRWHGWTVFARCRDGSHRCKRCRARAVSQRRRKVKAALVAEFGGACAMCGYSRYAGALQFHHLDPEAKSFSLASRGLARSLAKARDEARKCVLLCGNCHAEVEAGVATLPSAGPADTLCGDGSPIHRSGGDQYTGRG